MTREQNRQAVLGFMLGGCLLVVLAANLDAQVVTVAAPDTPEPVFSSADYQVPSGDSKPTIQAAINSCKAWPGCEVVLLAGTHTISAAIGLGGDSRNNITVRGLGMGATTIDCSGTPAWQGAFMVSSDPAWDAAEHIAIRDLTVDGRGSLPQTGTRYGLVTVHGNGFKEMSELRFERLELLADSVAMSGIAIDGDLAFRDVVMSGLRIESAGYGIVVKAQGTGRDLWVRDSVVTILDIGQEVYNGISIYGGAHQVHVTGNTVYANHFNAHSAIALSPAANAVITGNVVFGSTRDVDEEPPGEGNIEVERKTGHGGDGCTSHHVLVANNVVRDGYFGIGVLNRTLPAPPGEPPHAVSVTGNLISGNERGIWLNGIDPADVYIASNALFGNVTDLMIEP